MENKTFMTSAEAASYLSMGLSTLHKKTMRKEIPCYKPTGKNLYFKAEELDAWIARGRVKTDAEIEREAQAYCMQKGGRK